MRLRTKWHVRIGGKVCGKELKQQMATWADVYSIPEWAASAELCTRTLKQQGIIRLHLHGWCMLPFKQEHLQIKDFVFKESVPHHSGFKVQFNRGAAARWAGCFYVAVPKIGSVFTTSIKEMFTDYGVSPSWAWGEA